MPRHVLFIFVDGLGIGACDDRSNPLSFLELAEWEEFGLGSLCGSYRRIEPSHISIQIDANLGVEGLPQSGTGQATLFTGINCAQLIGRHHGPYPHSKTLNALKESNIFARLIAGGVDSSQLAFANAYPQRFFDYVNRTNRWTVTTRCCLDSGIRIRTIDDVLSGDAVTADLTRTRFRRIEPRAPEITAEQSGIELGRLAMKHTFTLFEYYATDKAGHSQDRNKATYALTELGKAISSACATMNREESLVLLTSDHGNVEDLSTKSHTRNPVPLIARGSGARRFAGTTSILEVSSIIEELVLSEQTA